MKRDPDAPTLRKPQRQKKFERKREEILNAATLIMNAQGSKGMTLFDVARAVTLNTTSITYYFARKELLAVAVFDQTMIRLQDMVREAASEPDPMSRVHRFLEMHIELRADVIRGKAVPLATLADLRTLETAMRLPLEQSYRQIFRGVRAFFSPPDSTVRKDVQTARAHMLLEVIFWLPISIGRFPLDEFPRVSRRLFDILAHGVAKEGAPWRPAPLVEAESDEGKDALQGSTENFLKVATRLINETGYHGASVVRIVEELKLTKGSFYHHLDAKDDLVLECFRRSYRRIGHIQALSRAVGGDEWLRLSSVISALLDIQFNAQWPLTRSTALQALPAALREEAVERSDRIAMRLAGNLIEGTAEGSMRLVDPIIASQVIIAALNSAYDLRRWASRLERADAIAIYASTIRKGLFAEDAGL